MPEFTMISRDALFDLLVAAAKKYKHTGCFVVAVVFARKTDAEAYRDSRAHVVRFDEPKPVLSPAPGGLWAVALAAFLRPTVPEGIPCSGHVAHFERMQCTTTGAADLALQLESKIAAMAFEYFEAPKQVADVPISNDPDAELGRMVRRMIDLGHARLVVDRNGEHAYWYVLLEESPTKHVIGGAGNTPEEALTQAIKRNR